MQCHTISLLWQLTRKINRVQTGKQGQFFYNTKERNAVSETNNMNEFMPWWRVDFGDEAVKAAHDAVAQRRMTMGPLTKAFEERVAKLLGVPYVVATASGTAALSLALIEAGIKSGDEVIVPNRTWIATAHAAYLLGANVVLVDVEPDRPIMDIKAFEAAITPRTKAVIPVHLNGRAADMQEINMIAQEHGIAVIEDACQALFSKNAKGEFLGCDSRAGCFSLSIGKAISSGQGGFVVTRDVEVARRLTMARTHGTSDITMAHWEMPGGNFRFWDLPAAVALTQLDRWDARNADIMRVYERYKKGLAGIAEITLLENDVDKGELPLYVECLSPRRDELVAYLAEQGIQARPYYANISDAPHFSDTNKGAYPNSDIYAKQCYVLPCGPDRTDAEIDRVLKALRTFF